MTFPKSLLLQGEYYDGKYLSAPKDPGAATVKDAKGWYGLAAYTFPKQPLTGFYRYDKLDSGDPNDFGRDTVGLAFVATWMTGPPVTGFFRYDTLDSGDANDFSRNTVGVAFDRSKTERFTLQLENIKDDGKGASFNNWAVQWQVKY